MEPSSYAAPPGTPMTGVVPASPSTNNQQDDSELLDNADSSPFSFSHAKLSHFDISKLTPKGPRKNADFGRPHDATRELVSIGDTLSAGSWWCAEGGWPSPAQRVSTEVFFVLSGRGCVTDVDGMRHEFAPGDTVVLPKGWSGRWDIYEAIHKIWFVNEHERIEEKSRPIRAIVTPFEDLAVEFLTPQGPMEEAIHGNPMIASGRLYHVGPTTVGSWACTPGSFIVNELPKTECFIVLDGTFVLSDENGQGQRCTTGDTVVLPKGWSGYWDVIETVRKLWVVVD
jgi:uncharacterized cupin superfamily protein